MEILNIKELADFLGCSISSIRNMVRAFTIPYFRSGNRLNFNKQTIETWIRNQEMQNTQFGGNETNVKTM